MTLNGTQERSRLGLSTKPQTWRQSTANLGNMIGVDASKRVPMLLLLETMVTNEFLACFDAVQISQNWVENSRCDYRLKITSSPLVIDRSKIFNFAERGFNFLQVLHVIVMY